MEMRPQAQWVSLEMEGTPLSAPHVQWGLLPRVLGVRALSWRVVSHIVGYWSPGTPIGMGTTAPGGLSIEGPAGGGHGSGKAADWDWWSRETLGRDPVPEGLKTALAGRVRRGQRSRLPPKVNGQREPAVPFNSCCWECTQQPEHSTQHPASTRDTVAPQTEVPALPAMPRTTRPCPRAPLSSSGAPHVSPPRVRTHEAQAPGPAQGHPRVPPCPLPGCTHWRGRRAARRRRAGGGGGEGGGGGGEASQAAAPCARCRGGKHRRRPRL